MTQERAQEIFDNAKRNGGWNWIEHLQMTDEEDKYVRAVWDTMHGDSSYWDAFNKIRRGKI